MVSVALRGDPDCTAPWAGLLHTGMQKRDGERVMRRESLVSITHTHNKCVCVSSCECKCVSVSVCVCFLG